MVAFKLYGSPKNAPKNEEEKKENCFCLINFSGNELSCVHFKRTSYTAKKSG